MSKRIALLLGGRSSERDVSINSGKAVSAALKTLGHEVIELDPQHDFIERLQAIKPDVVYNSLHGTYGEDGIIPGILEYLHIPYTHSGVMTSAMAMNKIMTKKLLLDQGVKFAEGMHISLESLIEMLKSGKEPMPRPYVIKPVSQGSTLGVFIIKEGESGFLERTAKEPWQYGQPLMVEKYIAGKELSAVVLNGKAIGVLELRPSGDFYDYKAKYTSGITEHIYPAEIPEDIYKTAMEYAQIAHNVLECRTFSRSDLRYDPSTNELCFLEINTHPGFTNLSIVPEVAAYNGVSFEKLVELILSDAKCENQPQ